jgi:hypothetical protein
MSKADVAYLCFCAEKFKVSTAVVVQSLELFNWCREAYPSELNRQVVLLACLDLTMKLLERYPRSSDELCQVCFNLSIPELYLYERKILRLTDFQLWNFTSIDYYIGRYFEAKSISPSNLFITIDGIKNTLFLYLAWKSNPSIDIANPRIDAAVVIEAAAYFLTGHFLNSESRKTCYYSIFIDSSAAEAQSVADSSFIRSRATKLIEFILNFEGSVII